MDGGLQRQNRKYHKRRRELYSKHLHFHPLGSTPVVDSWSKLFARRSATRCYNSMVSYFEKDWAVFFCARAGREVAPDTDGPEMWYAHQRLFWHRGRFSKELYHSSQHWRRRGLSQLQRRWAHRVKKWCVVVVGRGLGVSVWRWGFWLPRRYPLTPLVIPELMRSLCVKLTCLFTLKHRSSRASPLLAVHFDCAPFVSLFCRAYLHRLAPLMSASRWIYPLTKFLPSTSLGWWYRDHVAGSWR